MMIDSLWAEEELKTNAGKYTPEGLYQLVLKATGDRDQAEDAMLAAWHQKAAETDMGL